MSLITLEIPKEYGYVLTATAGTFFIVIQLGFWHGYYGASFRKATGVRLPQVFAEQTDFAAAADNAEKKKALYLFNCAQRAHANFNENHASVIGGLLIAGLRYPIAAASLGAAWSVARVLYTLGYTAKNRENGSGRQFGFLLSMLSSLGLWGLAGWTGIQMIR